MQNDHDSHKQDSPEQVNVIRQDTQGGPRRRPRVGWLEGLVGLSVIVALAGVVSPIVGGATAQDAEGVANIQMLHIIDGLQAYSRDTLYLPTGNQGRTDVSWLYGPGVIPSDNPFAAGGEARPLEDALLIPAMGGRNWSGPYLDELVPDPWGNAYLVNVDGLIDSREEPMVLSAGPDGIVQTQPFESRPAGDDLLLLMH
jgi:hypothetical protein